jgi:hypothetical protein
MSALCWRACSRRTPHTYADQYACIKSRQDTAEGADATGALSRSCPGPSRAWSVPQAPHAGCARNKYALMPLVYSPRGRLRRRAVHDNAYGQVSIPTGTVAPEGASRCVSSADDRRSTLSLFASRRLHGPGSHDHPRYMCAWLSKWRLGGVFAPGPITYAETRRSCITSRAQHSLVRTAMSMWS